MSRDPQSPSDAADIAEDDFDEDEFEFECGAWINGKFDFSSCTLAGTEDCDWECPESARVRGLRK